MKKTLLLLASAALLLVGCAKEQLSNVVDGGMTSVTFSASVDGGVATKAFADGDGKGANVNRCIMEIYFQDQLYKRMEAAMSGTQATATFANVPVVAGKQYQVLFWADCGGNGQIDKYYTTKTEGQGNKGLKAVTVNKSNFIDALKAKKNDELDAFFAASNYTVSQQASGNSFTVRLHRPFAQLNVITTDVADGKTVTCADLLPEKVSVSYTAATTFNVADSTVTGSATYAYEAPVYGDKTNWETVKTRGEFTLSMDYLLASTEQELVNVTFVTKNGGQSVMTHNLTNLPYKRNYRTNVKGELLTVGGTWKAEIEPKWGNGTDTGEIDHKIATSYTEVKTALQSGDKSDNLKVTVTPAAVNNLSEAEKEEVIVDETIDGEQVKALKFVLYEEKKDGEQVTQHASPKHVEFELPIRPTDVKAWKIQYEPAYPTETVVVSTKEEDYANVIIEAPKSTVTLDARKINSVVSTTSENTLIIPQGLELKNLVVKKGAVEYHGTGLTMVKVEATGTDKVYFKTSEGLANTDAVYGVVKDHVAPGYAISKESADTWKIVPVVCKIGETGYGSLADAVAAVPENTQTTITMVGNDYYEVNKPIEIGANLNVVLDLNGKTVSAVAPSGYGSALITNKGVLTINDSGSEGKLLMLANSPDGRDIPGYASNTVTNHGNLVVNGGIVQNETTSSNGQACYPIDNQTNGNSYSPTVEINGGRFITKSNAALRLFCNSTTNDNMVTINGGYFEAVYYAISIQSSNVYANKGTVVIKDGEFEATADEWNCSVACWSGNSAAISLTINGGKFNDYIASEAGTNKISGGLFKYNEYDEYKLADYVADGYAVVANTDATTKVQYPWTVDRKHVAMIGSTKYYTLAEAVAAVPTDGTQTTITMIADHEILGNDGVTIDKTKNVILDLAGYTIKNLVNENKRSQVIKNLGTLKIIDSVGDGLITNSAAEGAITGEWWSTPQYNYQTNVIYNYGGHLIIDGANLLETATSSICYAIDNNSNENDVTITIKSGHISTLASTAIRMFCNSTTKENIINVEGGLIEGEYAGIWTQLPGSGSEKKKGTLNISGGTLKGTYAWYDYTFGDLFDEVKVNISGGLLDGEIFSYGANIDISGGVFKSYVAILQDNPSNISVTGGKFKSDVYAYVEPSEGQYEFSKFISGGLFEQDSDCCWTVSLVDGKTYVALTESDPGYADGYRFKVVDQPQQ